MADYNKALDLFDKVAGDDINSLLKMLDNNPDLKIAIEEKIKTILSNRENKNKVTSEQCKWCNGTGTDSKSYIYGGCPDCEGTGFKFGKAGEDKFDQEIEEMYEKHLKEMEEDV